jgi:HEAT repeat protein
MSSAMRMLVEKKDIPWLIAVGRQIDGPLASDNVADVLSTLESDELYATITDLMKTENTADKRFAARILRSLDSDRTIEFLISMLLDSDPEVRFEAIFSLRGSRGPQHHQPPYKDDRVVARMFELLDDKDSGRWAADYLQELSDPDIVFHAKTRFQKSDSDTERLNLCTVIAKSEPTLTVPAVFSALANYDDSLEELRDALIALGEENVVPRIYDYLDPQHLAIDNLILDVLHHPGFASALSEQVSGGELQ